MLSRWSVQSPRSLRRGVVNLSWWFRQKKQGVHAWQCLCGKSEKHFPNFCTIISYLFYKSKSISADKFQTNICLSQFYCDKTLSNEGTEIDIKCCFSNLCNASDPSTLTTQAPLTSSSAPVTGLFNECPITYSSRFLICFFSFLGSFLPKAY